MQPPWTAAITGTRARSMQLKLSCMVWTWRRNASRARPGSLSWAASVVPAQPKSRPAVKCLPVEATTTARTVGSASIATNALGTSVQKAAFIVLSCAGRVSVTVAMPSAIASFKVSSSTHSLPKL